MSQWRMMRIATYFRCWVCRGRVINLAYLVDIDFWDLCFRFRSSTPTKLPRGHDEASSGSGFFQKRDYYESNYIQYIQAIALRRMMSWSGIQLWRWKGVNDFSTACAVALRIDNFPFKRKSVETKFLIWDIDRVCHLYVWEWLGHSWSISWWREWRQDKIYVVLSAQHSLMEIERWRRW